jgi:TM2 domain-containing membrane protein YozV
MFFHLCFIASAKDITATIYLIDSSNAIVSSEQIVVDDNKPNPILKLFKKKQRLNKRITAAVLAFPFPFGIVGLHRIYLGTKPHVPVVYIGSLGGIFGLLPLIDFIAITTTKDFEHYRDNGDVFMWIKD